MGEGRFKGKGINATAKDVADGFLFLNPIVLKKLEPEGFKALHHELKKIETAVRGENFPSHDTEAIRRRNMKLQRLHNSLVILKHCAREKKVVLV
jgi:hypothetical protein